ncbi:MAG: hypothetical protein LUE27_02475 [Clostridia bacterium]|nr:hypothetical protein [Clostridia bacterium]
MKNKKHNNLKDNGFTEDFEAAFSANPSRLYEDKFYELTNTEIIHKGAEILREIGIAGNGLNQPELTLRED